MDKKEFDEKLKIVKLTISSLFARKQPFLIVDCRHPDTFYFTNIERERVAIYKASMDDVVSRVTVVDDKVIDALQTAFPIFKESIIQIDITKFGKYLNKSLKYRKNEFPEIALDVQTRLVTMKLRPDEENANRPDALVEDAVIGVVLSELDVEFYSEILNNYEKFSDNVVRRSFSSLAQSGDDKVALKIVEVSNEYGRSEFAFPFKDGFNAVSANEYIRKRAIQPDYGLILRVSPSVLTAKAIVEYADDWLRAVTFMPGSLWFMSKLG